MTDIAVPVFFSSELNRALGESMDLLVGDPEAIKKASADIKALEAFLSSCKIEKRFDFESHPPLYWAESKGRMRLLSTDGLPLMESKAGLRLVAHPLLPGFVRELSKSLQ